MKPAPTLAGRLGPVQDTLTDLEREHRAAAHAEHDPDAWATWADLSRALMAVRSAQARDARAHRDAQGEAAPAPGKKRRAAAVAPVTPAAWLAGREVKRGAA